MKTLLLKNTEEDIKTAAELLKNGGVVGIPTETVYGLAADALNPEAVKKIFKAKGRPGDNPLIVHICDFSDIERLNLVTKIPDTAKKLADAFWPGPLTMIMLFRMKFRQDLTRLQSVFRATKPHRRLSVNRVRFLPHLRQIFRAHPVRQPHSML